MKLINKDKRGYIKDLFDKPSNSVILIESKKGTVRANHYHKKTITCVILFLEKLSTIINLSPVIKKLN